MESLPYLYVMDPADNVATALSDLRAGEKVPVLDQNGGFHGEITLRSHVPRFFKVTLRDLIDGDPVTKWGRTIGAVPTHPDWAHIDQRPLPAGTVAHFTNFLPTRHLVNHWGDHLARPASIIMEQFWRNLGQGVFPFEFARARTGLTRHIFEHDIEFPPGLRDILLPAAKGGDEGLHIGYALEPIAAGGKLHLGCIVPKQGHMFPGDPMMVHTIQSAYRFIKDNMHDLGA